MGFEVESRAILSKEQYELLLNTLQNCAKFTEQKRRLSLCFTRIETLDARELLNETIDLRVRITNNSAEIVLKQGSWSVRDQRREITVQFEKKDFWSAVELLCNLGWTTGFIAETQSAVFTLNDLEFAVVKTCDNLYYVEAEKVVRTKDSSIIQSVQAEIEEAFAKLHIRTATENEYHELLNTMNRKHGRFNFEKQSIEEFRRKYETYF